MLQLMCNQKEEWKMEINMKGYNLENFKDKDLYTWEEIISKIEDMESEICRLNEENEEIKRDVEDNYKRLSQEEQIEFDERW